MRYEIHSSDDKTILEIEGNIFVENLQELKDALDRLAKESSSSIILDFTNVGAITSYGLRELIMFENQMSSMGKIVDIVNASKIVSDLMKMARKIYV